MDHNAMKKWIDMRYKITHGNLEYKLRTKDDPMGLALFADSRILEPTPGIAPSAASAKTPIAELDAFAKGKGKGKGDSRCHTCNGEWHFARDCPSPPPVSPQAV